MSKDQLQTKSDLPAIDPFEKQDDVMLVVAFPRSTSKNYSVALSLAQQSGEFRTGLIGSTVMNVAYFHKTLRDANIAKSLIGYVSGWKGTMLFSGGIKLTPWYDVTRTLECYIRSGACRDYRAHCVTIIDDPNVLRSRVTGFFISTAPVKTKYVEVKRYAFPCSELLSDMNFQRGHPSSIEDQIHAAGVATKRYLCPRFDPDAFSEVGVEIQEIDDYDS